MTPAARVSVAAAARPELQRAGRHEHAGAESSDRPLVGAAVAVTTSLRPHAVVLPDLSSRPRRCF